MQIRVASILLSAGVAFAGCKPPSATTGSGGGSAPPAETFRWKMVTTWPKNFPVLGTGAERFARALKEMSGGRLAVKVYGAGEIVPALEVFDAVSQGTVEMGHGAAYYWKGKLPEAQWFASVPFGFNAREMNGWLHYGGGLELWRELYEPHGLVPFAAGNSGTQMGGWFNKEIKSLDDIRGLKMRIPGLGGEVLKRAGGAPVLLPGGEIFTALQTGAIDATEWVGPYNDLAFGLHKAAKYYYYPGWHEPGVTLELLVNAKAYEGLPPDLRAIVKHATRSMNQDMLDEFTARNAEAIRALVAEHGVQLRAFPPDVLAEFRRISEEVRAEEGARSPAAKKIMASFTKFLEGTRGYYRVAEDAYTGVRD